MTSLRVLTVEDIKADEDIAHQLSGFWDQAQNQRLNQITRWDETRKYLFATDTRHTSAKSNPWKNNTTRPKLTWLYDKALTSYTKKLLPNDHFFRWKSSPRQHQKVKANVIEHWMVHKLRNKFVSFRSIVGRCLGDWLSTGNAFAGVEYVKKYEQDLITGEKKLVFKGAKPYRISPWFANLDASAEEWNQSMFIHRRLIPKEQFLAFAEDNPDFYNAEAVEKVQLAHSKAFGRDVVDYMVDSNRNIDGVSIYDQWDSGVVEILEYYGAIRNHNDNKYESNQHLIVADRSFLLLKEPNPSFLVEKPIVFSSFRKRPDNLWGMGPLENLVGMQYRIDHEENVKADALDACAYPIRKITGDSTSEKYELKPGAEWYVPLNGDVELIYPDPRVAMFESDILGKERAMEEFAGLPRETAGFRTPGEKTGFEVQSLMSSAAEFPDEKLAEFESNFLEPLLNLLLELNIRNLDQFDLDSIPEEDLKEWGNISLDDLKVDGRIYPIGIKHSAERAQKISKIQGLVQIGASIAPEHLSKFRALEALQEESNLDEDHIIEFGAGLQEQAQLTKMSQLLQQQEQERNPDASAQQVEAAGGKPGEQQQ